MKWLAILTVSVLFFLSLSSARASHVNCGENINYSTVLDSDLTCTGNGLIIGASNIVLDCDGYTIQGSNSSTGIYMLGHQNVTIKNCVVQSFTNGLYLQDSNSNTLQNIIANNNIGGITNGLFISGSNNNLQNITANNNFGGIDSYGLRFTGSNNTLQNIIANNNEWGLDVYTSNNNTFQNIQASYNYHGFRFIGSGSTFQNIQVSYNNFIGLSISGSNNNILQNITANNNDQGIFVSSLFGYPSVNNTVSSSTVYSNTVGLYMAGSNNNTLQNIQAYNNSYAGLYIGGTNNTIQNITAFSNTQYGLLLRLLSGSIIQNITANNNGAGLHLLDSSPGNILQNINASFNKYSGISLENSNNNTLQNIQASFNSTFFSSIGVYISNSHNNNLQNIQASSHSGSGVTLSFSNNNNLQNINANYNSNYNGISLYYSSGNILQNIQASSNNVGFAFANSDSNTLQNTIANNNFLYGLNLYYSNNNNLQNITASNNRGVSYARGLDLYVSNNNILQNITANNNSQYGLSLDGSKKNTISSSTLISNAYGVYIFSNSPNNTIFNNFFNNTINAFNNAGTNYWNISKTPGTNIIGGPYIGGNFWHDYMGQDLDGDGLGDTLLPYNSNGGILNGGDFLPLVQQNQPPVLDPIGDKTANENETLTIQLTASDPENGTLTFGTNAGSVLPSPFSFNPSTGLFQWTPGFLDYGNYTVRFNVSDGQASDEEAILISVADAQTATFTISGKPNPKKTVNFSLTDPAAKSQRYIFALSLSNSTGFPLGDGRKFPLNNDTTFYISINSPEKLFLNNSKGEFSSLGQALVNWKIPAIGPIGNLTVYAAYFSYDPDIPLPKGIISISQAAKITISKP